MVIIPAVDLKDGCCVRLQQGREDAVTVYSDDPVNMAKHWESEGAEYLHVVDLDGAFQGHPVHAAVIAEMADAVSIPVEVGGGLRTDEDIRLLLDSGVERAIIGTRAVSRPEELERLVGHFGLSLAVGIDARDGNVQVRGWVETTAMTAMDLATRVDRLGVGTLIYTDTSRDGMLKGANAAATGEMCDRVNCDVIASGGVTSTEDVRALAALDRPNLVGAIVGKALYDGRTTLPELKKGLAG
jgi:phosphoribosylformimino-5-aminoimidazole carboxamide ribotide isomerase